MNWTKAKLLFGNSILVFVGIASALFLAEVVLRLAWPIIEPERISTGIQDAVIRPDPILGSVIIPGSHNGVNDSRGFKNKVALDRAEIVALGDSHTHGPLPSSDGVDHSWPSELARRASTTVYNMGVWGYGPVQYSVLLEHALLLHPKVVVVGLWLGNDVFDAYDLSYHQEAWVELRDPNFANASPKTISDTKQLSIPFRDLRQWVRDRSKLYFFLGDRTRIWREKIGLSSPRTVGTRDWSTTDPDASLLYDDPEQKTLFWVNHRVQGVDLTDANVKEGLRITKSLLPKMNQDAQRAGAELLIVLLPSKMSAYSDLVRGHELTNITFEKIIENEDKIREEILLLCSAAEIQCVDALPTIQSHLADGEKLYPEDWDEHPVSNGYAVYAEVVEAEIKRSQIQER